MATMVMMSASRLMESAFERTTSRTSRSLTIVLLWLEGIPYDEIGAITGISAKNVGVRLTRIRLELKNMTD